MREFEQIYPMLEKKHKITRMKFLLEGVVMQPGLMQQDQIHPLGPATFSWLCFQVVIAKKFPST